MKIQFRTPRPVVRRLALWEQESTPHSYGRRRIAESLKIVENSGNQGLTKVDKARIQMRHKCLSHTGLSQDQADF